MSYRYSKSVVPTSYLAQVLQRSRNLSWRVLSRSSWSDEEKNQDVAVVHAQRNLNWSQNRLQTFTTRSLSSRRANVIPPRTATRCKSWYVQLVWADVTVKHSNCNENLQINWRRPAASLLCIQSVRGWSKFHCCSYDITHEQWTMSIQT